MSGNRKQPTMVAILGALVLSGVAAMLLAPMAAAAPVAQHPAPTPLPDYSKTTCVVSTTTQIQPGAFLIGDTIAVERTARAGCAGLPVPLHIVLVLDGTASMAGAPRDELERAMREFVADVEGNLAPDGRLAVVTFDTRARELCPLTDRFDRVRRCFNRLDARGNATIGDGLQAGVRTLVAGRGLWPTLPAGNFREVIILASTGADATRCDEAERQAGQVSNQGVLLITVCVGRDCNVRCMSGLATSRRYYFEARGIAQLSGVFEQIRHSHASIVLRRMTITETLPVGVNLVDGSPSPPPTAVLDNPTRVVWTTGYVPSEGYTVTYRVQPRVAGRVALSAGALGAFLDNRDLRGTFAFDVPRAQVLGKVAPGTP